MATATATATALTTEAAIAYVVAYYRNEGFPEPYIMEGLCAFRRAGESYYGRVEPVDYVHVEAGFPDRTDVWTVWSEPLLDGALYGEF